SGRVTDPSGAVVSGAQVIARETETNLSSMTSTDQEGRFRFPYLKPGQYEISVSAPGFAEIKRAVTLTVGAAFDLPLSLNVAAVETMSMSRVNKPYWKRRERRSLATSFKRKSRIFPSTDATSWTLLYWFQECRRRTQPAISFSRKHPRFLAKACPLT